LTHGDLSGNIYTHNRGRSREENTMSDINANNGTLKNVPPYLPFSTFDNVLRELQGKIPHRIDKTVFNTKSGTTQNWIMGALKFFELIDVNGNPQTDFKTLVEAEDRTTLYNKLCRRYYADLLSSLDIESASQGQLDEWFRNHGISGSTITKCVAFFLDLAKRAGISTSPHFKKSKAGGTGIRKRPMKTPARITPTETSNDVECDPSDSAPALREKLILGLIEKLPDPEEEFPASKRELWKRMADTIFDMVYGEASTAS
jgi:hypothetical protein